MNGTISVESRGEPFPHASTGNLLAENQADAMLSWLEAEAPWSLRVEHFYEQHECALLASTLPPQLVEIVSPESIDRYARTMLTPIGASNLELTQATAHRLCNGQSIRVHNDYIGKAESHRILVQLNRGWSDENGGFLMLFSSASANDVARIIRPVHGSAVSFEISPNSFHAVSPTSRGERYTLVFTYRRTH